MAKIGRSRRPTDWLEMFVGLPNGNDGNSVFAPVLGLTEVNILLGDTTRFSRQDMPEDAQRVLGEMGRAILLAGMRSGVFMSNALALKFPQKCIVCGRQKGCGCNPNQKHSPAVFTAVPPRPDLVALSLDEWQDFLFELYGEQNRSRGIDKVLLRLVEEISEALKEVVARHEGKSVAQHHALHNEFADVFAWWIAVCNLHGLRAEELLHGVYERRLAA